MLASESHQGWEEEEEEEAAAEEEAAGETCVIGEASRFSAFKKQISGSNLICNTHFCAAAERCVRMLRFRSGFRIASPAD